MNETEVVINHCIGLSTLHIYKLPNALLTPS